MQNLEQIKKLQKNSKEISEFYETNLPKWQAEPKYFDKVRYGFKEGDNDGWYKGATVTLHFGAWVGIYGDSSTYMRFAMDGDIFRKHFMAYVKKHEKEIMLAMQASIDAEAKTLLENAQKEVEANQQLLNSLAVS